MTVACMDREIDFRFRSSGVNNKSEKKRERTADTKVCVCVCLCDFFARNSPLTCTQTSLKELEDA